jgi:NADH dehydrogenase
VLNAVTGAFGYTGKHITERLLAEGTQVVNLTGHLDRPNPFGEQVSVAPLDFARPEVLARSLEGAEVLYNTYWVRFARGAVTFDTAVENSRNLLRAAEDAGVRRIVHISITNASPDSRLPYFRGKGLVEAAVKASGMSHAIIKPTVIFGPEDILVNNIAWFLRRFPVFPVFGSGRYAVQPVFVEDLAEIAVDAAQASGDVEMDAVGPETLTFNEMLNFIGDSIGSRTLFTHLPPALVYGLSGLVGYVVRDVVITRDEIEGLMAGLLVSAGQPTAHTRLSEWLSLNAETVGARYASELRRHYR